MRNTLTKYGENYPAHAILHNSFEHIQIQTLLQLQGYVPSTLRQPLILACAVVSQIFPVPSSTMNRGPRVRSAAAQVHNASLLHHISQRDEGMNYD